MLAMMMLQATVSAAGQTPPIDFDLRSSGVLKTCSYDYAPADNDDIQVCGRRDPDSRYRLKPLDTSRFESDRRAETTLIGDLKGSAEVEKAEIAPGMISNRIMFRLKLPS